MSSSTSPKLITELTAKALCASVSKPSLIAAYPTLPIREALHLLAQHNVTCLPLFSHDKAKIVSIVNTFDIMLYIVRNVGFPQHKELDPEKLPKLEEPVENVLGLDSDLESYRMYVTDADDPLKETLLAFSRSTHRALVVSYPLPNSAESSDSSWLLTQSDVIRYIHDHPESLSPEINLSVSIGELGLGLSGKEVVSARSSETALETYRRMAEKNVLGLPILDDEGNLISGISASDLRGITATTLATLALPVKEFLKNLPTKTFVATATSTTTLQELIRLVVEVRAHRVWIVEGLDSRKVVDVATLSDILRVLVK